KRFVHWCVILYALSVVLVVLTNNELLLHARHLKLSTVDYGDCCLTTTSLERERDRFFYSDTQTEKQREGGGGGCCPVVVDNLLAAYGGWPLWWSHGGLAAAALRDAFKLLDGYDEGQCSTNKSLKMAWQQCWMTTIEMVCALWNAISFSFFSDREGKTHSVSKHIPLIFSFFQYLAFMVQTCKQEWTKKSMPMVEWSCLFEALDAIEVPPRDPNGPF
ncbi:hypothetical protein M8C21_031423, partial [Ambrosia artemisiifolia]